MKLSLLIGFLSVLASVQSEITSTNDQGNPSNSTNPSTTDMTASTSAWNGPVNITEPTTGTKWEAGSLNTINWIVLNHNGTDNSTTGGNSTHCHPGNNSTDGSGHGDGDDDGDKDHDHCHGNDTDTNHTQTDHLSIQLAVSGNVQAVDLVFPLADNVSKSNGTAQILVPQQLAGGKNYTLVVGQPDQGVSFVSGIDIENNNDNGTHDKNGSVNPDTNASLTASSPE